MSNYRASVESALSPEIEAFIESVVFGHSGVRYQRLNVRKQWSRFNNPRVLCLREKSTLVGLYVLDPRECVMGDKNALGIYRALLCVRTDQKRRGASSALIDQSLVVIEQWADQSELPVFSYGCIESSNTPSMRLLSKAGCHSIGRLKAQLIYRQWPKSVLDLQENDAPIDKGLWFEDNAASGLWDTTKRSCVRLSVTDSSGIRISATAVQTALQMQSLGAVNDVIIRCFVTPFPFARRRFDANNFKFVVLTHLYVRPGCEGDWPSFVSSVIKRYGLHYAQLIADAKSPVIQRLKLAKVFDDEKGSTLQVMARAENEGAKELMAQSPPMYVYPVDL